MRSSRAAWLFLVVALIVAFAHVCALPGHSHAAEALPQSHHAETPQDGSHGGGGMHGASCDAVRPVPGTSAGAVVAVHPRNSFIAARLALSNTHIDAVPPTPSPPLFLLHRSLLI